VEQDRRAGTYNVPFFDQKSGLEIKVIRAGNRNGGNYGSIFHTRARGTDDRKIQTFPKREVLHVNLYLRFPTLCRDSAPNETVSGVARRFFSPTGFGCDRGAEIICKACNRHRRVGDVAERRHAQCPAR
jgi:hypothetical protein